MPAVEGQAAGAPLSFFVRGGQGSQVDRVQVRYSPTGSTDTGSGADAVGNFTELLLDWQSQKWGVNDWTEQKVTLPGPGRVAFRYFLPKAATCTGYLLRLDAVTIGTPPPGRVALPQAGQTVPGDQASSPVVIDGRTVIPKGGTVEVQPGVEIRTTAGSSLVVDGTLRGRRHRDRAGHRDRPVPVPADARCQRRGRSRPGRDRRPSTREHRGLPCTSRIPRSAATGPCSARA